MPKTVSISWLKQKSGNYALKGITIYEDARAYDAMSTFRDEDARWLTKMLGARPHIELSGNGVGQRSSDDYPGWALDMEGQGADSDNSLPLDCERAGATFLRHVLEQLIEPCNTGNESNRFQKLVEETKSALLTADAGTYYTLDEARTVLDRRGKQAAKIKRRP
ncbi:MAG TPA: hypothetical protein VEX13_03115 [Chloroflexia bacterium]|nr:hypothetical protein [Chloroflexia bacterium]